MVIDATAASNPERMNVDVECRCTDSVGQNFCVDFKKKVAESAAYKLVDNTGGFGIGVHLTCVDMWKGIVEHLTGHMSAVSVAFTVYSESLPGEMLEDNSVLRVGTDNVSEASREIISALGQLVTANASLFDRLRAANEKQPSSGETSGASAGGPETSAPSP
jgi:hypothetical protein